MKKREEQAQLERTASGVNQCTSFGTVIAVGVIGGLGYSIYWSRKGPATAGQGASTIREIKDVSMSHNPPKQHPQTNKFEMD